jgi:hypothetical protein
VPIPIINNNQTFVKCLPIIFFSFYDFPEKTPLFAGFRHKKKAAASRFFL